MTADRPVPLLRYAEDLTRADVDAVHDFLMGRVRPLAYDGPVGAAQKTALGFATALTHLAAALHHDLLYPQPAGAAAEAERLRRVRTAWNSLWHLAAPWRDADGYDARRWTEPAATASITARTTRHPRDTGPWRRTPASPPS